MNFIYNTFYQILTILIPLITTPYISRILGANGIGTFSYYYSIASYFVLFIMLGLNNYGNREIARCRNNYEVLADTFWNIYAMQLFLGIIINIIYFIFCISIAHKNKIAIIMTLYVISGIFDVNWVFFEWKSLNLLL